MSNNNEDHLIYKVVVNHEDQYSIWFTHRQNPLGWQDVGTIGTKEECLQYIKNNWKDMRPRSLRESMDLDTTLC